MGGWKCSIPNSRAYPIHLKLLVLCDPFHPCQVKSHATMNASIFVAAVTFGMYTHGASDWETAPARYMLLNASAAYGICHVLVRVTGHRQPAALFLVLLGYTWLFGLFEVAAEWQVLLGRVHPTPVTTFLLVTSYVVFWCYLYVLVFEHVLGGTDGKGTSSMMVASDDKQVGTSLSKQ